MIVLVLSINGCELGRRCSDVSFIGVYRLARISVPAGTTMVGIDSIVDAAAERWWVECDEKLEVKNSELQLLADNTFFLRNSMLVDSVGKWHSEEWEDMCVIKLNFAHMNCIGHLAMNTDGDATLTVCDQMFREKCYVSTYQYQRILPAP
ncbi:MAG: hypothetical protein JNL43_09625 [Flavobacteriales bacterium]|nr:hypothetical protein [Flavobacteriales bacterium]